MSKWQSNHKPLHNNALVQALLKNQFDYYDKMYAKVEGPYFTDAKGCYITAEQAANPEYDPYVLFSADGQDYLYHLESEEFFIRVVTVFRPEADLPTVPAQAEYWPYSRIDISDWLIERIFSCTPKLYNSGVGDFLKFTMPLVKRAFPSLISQNLVSVQPMTQPLSSVFYLNQKYGSQKGSNVTPNQGSV
jgi:hypothetical protein